MGYPSVKAAIGAAARIAQHLGYPRAQAGERIQGSPDHDHLDASSQVRACLAKAGINPHGEEARLLYAWATRADGPDEWDELAESREGDERETTLEEGRRARARLAALLELVEPVLRSAGCLTPREPQIASAWRVASHDGTPRVLRVADPRPDDPSLIWSLDEARSLALGMLDDSRIVRTQTIISPRPARKVLHEDIQPEWIAAWNRGEYPSLAALDVALAETLGCSARWAATVRRRWGLNGTRGRNPTKPESNNLNQDKMISTLSEDGAITP